VLRIPTSLSSRRNNDPSGLPQTLVLPNRRDPRPEPTSQALNRALVQALCERMDFDAIPLIRYEANQVVIRSGQIVKRLPILISGRIDAVVQSGAGERADVVPIWFERGEIVMLSYLFSEQPGHVDMVAAEVSDVRWIDTSDIEELIAHDPAFAVLLVRFLSQRLREVQRRERAWVERGVPLRVAAALVRMTHDLSTVGGEWILNATHEHIAHCAGVSRPKASVALKKLEREGHIRLGRGRVYVQRLDALKSVLA
jgi:CRP-like cAMP-binding protein